MSFVTQFGEELKQILNYLVKYLFHVATRVNRHFNNSASFIIRESEGIKTH